MTLLITNADIVNADGRFTADILCEGETISRIDRGIAPPPGAEVIAHYEGRLLDGTSFDSSYRRGTPFVFRVGTGAVIKGWDEAFSLMKKGEKRTLIIPHWLGYGEKGSPPKIPGRATLIFEVELIDWR